MSEGIYLEVEQKQTEIAQFKQIQRELMLNKGHVRSYKINDREMVFNYAQISEHIQRLELELTSLLNLKAIYDGGAPRSRIFYRG